MLKLAKQGRCTSCGAKDDIEFVDERWRWIKDTSFTRTNCPSCGEWRSIAVIETKVETVLVPAELPPS